MATAILAQAAGAAVGEILPTADPFIHQDSILRPGLEPHEYWAVTAVLSQPHEVLPHFSV